MANICDLNDKKPQIDYPCEWKYKIVVDENLDAKKEVDEILKDKDFKFEKSHKSSNGKYVSYNISLEVQNEEERLRIFDDLKKISKYIL